MKRLLFILLAFTLFSCDPLKRVEKMKAKYCPLCTTNDSLSSSDSILTFLHDTIIEFHIQSDTFYMPLGDKIVFTKGHYLIAEKSFIYGRSQAWMTENGIRVLTIVKDTTLVTRLKNALTEKQSWKTKYENKKVSYPVYITKEVKYIPHLYLVTFWVMIAIVIGGIVYLLTRNGNDIYLWIAKQIVKLIPKFLKK